MPDELNPGNTIDPAALHEFTEVRTSQVSGAGLGLFAKLRIPRGTVWWRATPDNCLRIARQQYRVLLGSELSASARSRALLTAIQMFAHIDSETDELIVTLDDGRFVNHSDHPNSASAEEDPNNLSVAIRDIEAGEEITENYRTHTLDVQLGAIGGKSVRVWP